MAGALGSGACQRHVSDSALCTCSRAAVMADVSVTDCGSCHANARLTLQPPPRPRGLRSNLLMIAEMINKFHRKLFSQIIHPGHCLYQLLPSKNSAHCRYSLRERQHSFQLSKFELSQFKTVSSIDAYLNLDDFCITVRCVFLILCTLFVNSTFYFV